MEDPKSLAPVGQITGAIFVLRGHRVLLDAELATLLRGRDPDTDPGRAAQSSAFPGGFHVPAQRRRVAGFEITICSRQDKPGKGGSYVGSGNHSMESSGFDSHPAKANHQPEASLACECGDALLEA